MAWNAGFLNIQSNFNISAHSIISNPIISHTVNIGLVGSFCSDSPMGQYFSL